MPPLKRKPDDLSRAKKAKGQKEKCHLDWQVVLLIK